MSLDAGPGVLGLLGPNGAGKTSLLRMLATVLPPDAGQIRLLERDPGRTADRREIRRLGYLPQNLVSTAIAAPWGGPPVAPVLVGAIGLIMVCALGFTLGAIFPGRFTAPIVGIGLMIVTLAAFKQAVGAVGCFRRGDDR